MHVRDIMSQPVLTCGPETTLAAAACLMREADCGTLPVVDADGRIRGIITDRDICLAVGTSHRNARHIRVHEAMTSKVATIGALAEIGEALTAMTRARVRRLPVVDQNHRPIGLLSIDDVAVRGLDADAISSAAIALTLRSLCERRRADIDSDIHVGV